PWRPSSVVPSFAGLGPGNEAVGIHLPAILDDFEVHMRSGGAARAAHLGDHLATLHQFADPHHVLLVVGIERDIAVAMVDFHHGAVARLAARPGHHAGG